MRSDFTAANIHVTSHGTEHPTLQTPMGSIDVLLPLPGGTQYCQRAGGRCFINGGGATLAAAVKQAGGVVPYPRSFPIQLSETNWY